MKKSSLCRDLQSVNTISSIVLSLSVYFPAALMAISMTLRCFVARILTPYFLLIRLDMILGSEVKSFIVSAILLVLTAFLTTSNNSFKMGNKFFYIIDIAAF